MNTLYDTFRDAHAFNSSIEKWNTWNVETMYSTFRNAYAFNQNLSAWDTSRCTSMDSVFRKKIPPGTAAAFNRPLSDWDTSKVRYSVIRSTFVYSSLTD